MKCSRTQPHLPGGSFSLWLCPFSITVGTAAKPARVASAAPVRGGALVTNISTALLPLALAGFDADGDPLTAVVTSLPSHGALFQTADGVTPGAAMTTVPASVSDSGRRVLFRRQVGYTGPDEFRYALNDGTTFTVEASLDLIHWAAVPALIREFAPGRYEGSVLPPNGSSCFFRVGLAPK